MGFPALNLLGPGPVKPVSYRRNISGLPAYCRAKSRHTPPARGNATCIYDPVFPFFLFVLSSFWLRLDTARRLFRAEWFLVCVCVCWRV
jgi:hypothetical protein